MFDKMYNNYLYSYKLIYITNDHLDVKVHYTHTPAPLDVYATPIRLICHTHWMYIITPSLLDAYDNPNLYRLAYTSNGVCTYILRRWHINLKIQEWHIHLKGDTIYIYIYIYCVYKIIDRHGSCFSNERSHNLLIKLNTRWSNPFIPSLKTSLYISLY